ncbi:MAG: hypothetical protein WC869_09840 [Phycisphaerae bacterium]|jgi:hypothetical protein
MKESRLLRSVDFAILAIVLVGAGVALGALSYITASFAATETNPATRRFLARLAWMSLSLALLLMVVLAWVWIRHVRVRRALKMPEPTPYVDAWELAGKRFKLSPQQREAGERELAELDDEEFRGWQQDEEDKDGPDPGDEGEKKP